MSRRTTQRKTTITCSHCLREREPARRDAVLCSECSAKLYRRIEAGEQRVAAMTPEERRAEADALFARVKAGAEARR